MIYTTKDGDTLDKICFDYYAKQAGIVEQVLAVNPHLLGLGLVLNSGIEIELLDIKTDVITATTELF